MACRQVATTNHSNPSSFLALRTPRRVNDNHHKTRQQKMAKTPKNYRPIPSKGTIELPQMIAQAVEHLLLSLKCFVCPFHRALPPRSHLLLSMVSQRYDATCHYRILKTVLMPLLKNYKSREQPSVYASILLALNPASQRSPLLYSQPQHRLPLVL